MIKRALCAAIFVCLSAGMLACNKADDAATTAAIKTKLAADTTVPATSINVDTKEGVVTLTGTVDSEAQKSKAEQIAKSVEGVKSVTVNITVKPPPPIAVSPDQELKNTVMANMTKYNVTGVIVDVVNGEVTLKGDIPRAKLQDAMKAANEAQPRRVNNQLNIK